MANADSARTTVKDTTTAHMDKASLYGSVGTVLPDVVILLVMIHLVGIIVAVMVLIFNNISRPMDSTIHESTDSVRTSTAGDLFVLTTSQSP